MSIKSAWTLAANVEGGRMRLRFPLKISSWHVLRCLSLLVVALCVGEVAASAHGQSVVINEFLASNTSILADEDGDFEDWLELYNPTSAQSI